jgi:hypothetical protein
VKDPPTGVDTPDVLSQLILAELAKGGKSTGQLQASLGIREALKKNQVQILPFLEMMARNGLVYSEHVMVNGFESTSPYWFVMK